MSVIFNYDVAKEKMKTHLFRKKAEYEAGAKVQRVKSIDKVLADEKLLESFVNVQLMGDMVSILNSFNRLNESRLSNYIETNGLLSSSIDGGITIFSCGRVKIGGDDHIFTDSEEFRKYLYDSVGFTFETPEESLDNLRAGKKVVDPVARSYNGSYTNPPTIYRMLDYMDSIEVLPVPQRTSAKQYVK